MVRDRGALARMVDGGQHRERLPPADHERDRARAALRGRRSTGLPGMAVGGERAGRGRSRRSRAGCRCGCRCRTSRGRGWPAARSAITFHIERLRRRRHRRARCTRSPPSSCRADQENSMKPTGSAPRWPWWREPMMWLVVGGPAAGRGRPASSRRASRCAAPTRWSRPMPTPSRPRCRRATTPPRRSRSRHAPAWRSEGASCRRSAAVHREAAPDVDRLAGVPRRRRGRDGGVRAWSTRSSCTASNGEPLELSRPAVYTLAFFAFWLATMAVSALTTLLARSPFEVNRCPLPLDGRPAACPKTDGRATPSAWLE